MFVRFSNKLSQYSYCQNFELCISINLWNIIITWINFDNHLNFWYDDITDLQRQDIIYFVFGKKYCMLSIFGFCIEINKN